MLILHWKPVHPPAKFHAHLVLENSDFPVALHGVCRESDNRRSMRAQPFVFANDSRGFVAVHNRHLHVHQNQVERFPPGGFHGLLAICDHYYGMALPLQNQLRQPPVHRVVLCHQHTKLASRTPFDRGRPAERRPVAGSDHLQNRPEQIRPRDRLGEVRHQADLAQIGSDRFDVHGTQHHDPRRVQPGIRVNLAGHGVAIHLRHLCVQQHEVEPPAATGAIAQHLQRLRS